MTWGGKRVGAGRPKGTGTYGVPTKPLRIPETLVKQVLKFVKSSKPTDLGFPLYGCKVSAEFPSPADDYLEGYLDLKSKLIKHPAATLFVRVSGSSMINADIHDGDLLIVDRSLEPFSGKIVIAAINGELSVR